MKLASKIIIALLLPAGWAGAQSAYNVKLCLLYTSWLFNLPSATQPELENFEIHAVAPNGNPCMPGSLQAGDGATIDFTSTQGGIAYLSFDLNNDGDYVDLVDRTIIKDVAAGPNFIHWDGKNGLGQPLSANFSFTFGYKLELRDGETHILLSDIENNVGCLLYTSRCV